MIEKILERLREKRDKWLDVWSDASITDEIEDCFYADGMSEAFLEAMKIVQEVAKEYGNGWIPVESGQMPPKPKENPVFENKPLELYLVDCGVDYPFRAFWNGKFFTDGWSKVDAIAWMPLPPKYEPLHAPYQKGE